MIKRALLKVIMSIWNRQINSKDHFYFNIETKEDQSSRINNNLSSVKSQQMVAKIVTIGYNPSLESVEMFNAFSNQLNDTK